MDFAVRQIVPLLLVRSMDASLRFYVHGLGFTMKNKWIDDGKLRWCWLSLGGAAVMLQERREDGHHAHQPQGPVGLGVDFCFTCQDAIAFYHVMKQRGVQTKRPFVGNRMWVTSLTDPDGYRLHFESPTDASEESEYQE